MKVLNCSWDDFANFAYENFRALKSVGIDAEGFKIHPHPFGYKDQSVIVDYNTMKQYMRESDIVQIFHSDISLRDTFIQSGSKAKLIVYHTGSPYRMNPEKMNLAWNNIVSISLTDQTEFINLGAKNIRYIATAIDTEKIKPIYRVMNLPFRIAHYPSNAEVKGTRVINRLMTLLGQGLQHRFSYNWSDEKTDAEKQLLRMSWCDIYIELFMPELNGKPYGCFGVTAFEAAAMGKIVLTQNINREVYEKEYDFCPFILSDTEKEFFNNLESLVQEDKKQIRIRQTETRKWVEEKHSYKATGNKLKLILEQL